MKNRCRRARERAGLSLGQAAVMLGVNVSSLAEIERADNCGTSELYDLMADTYGVNKPWLLGEVPQYDDEYVKSVPGWEQLTAHDFETVAEFAASLPRKNKDKL